MVSRAFGVDNSRVLTKWGAQNERCFSKSVVERFAPFASGVHAQLKVLGVGFKLRVDPVRFPNVNVDVRLRGYDLPIAERKDAIFGYKDAIISTLPFVNRCICRRWNT